MKISVKYFFAGALALICTSEAMTGSFTDSRDGKTYRTQKMPDDRIWMAENLNFDYNHGTAESACYENKPENCEKYGRLYTWAAAMDSAAVFSRDGKGCGFGVECKSSGRVRGVCPEGWHLPSEDEFEKLLKVSCSKKGNFVKCDNLRASTWTNGSDKFGFSAVPAGSFDYNSGGDKQFSYGLDKVCFWSSTEAPYISSNPAIYWNLEEKNSFVVFVDKRYGFSVRCIQDDPVSRKKTKGTIKEQEDHPSVEPPASNTKAKGSIKVPSERNIGIGIEGNSRSVADIMKVVRQRIPGLRHIYNKYLKKIPGFQGEVTLKFAIAPSGKIASISVISSTTGSDEFDGEIKSAVGRWKFNEVESGNTTVTFPFSFSE